MDKETIINETLLREIETYCDLNGEDTTTFINKLLKKAYMEEKYQDILTGSTQEDEKKVEEKIKVINDVPPPKPIEKKENEKKPEPKRGSDINTDLYGE